MMLGDLIKNAQAKLGLDTAQVAEACGVGKAYIAGLRGNSKAHSISSRLAEELVKVLQLKGAKPAIEAHNKKHQAYRLSRKSKKVAAATVGIKTPKAKTPTVYRGFRPTYFIMTRENYGNLCFHLDAIQALLKETTAT